MSVRSWLSGWSRDRRRKKAAAENRDEPLREFVYLDEVSVFSLLASRIGALATDFTQSESSSLTSEVKGSGGVATPVAKANVSSAIKTGQSSGTQVMRKSTVQSTFKELYGYVRDSLILGPPDGNSKAPSIERVEDLVRAAEKDSAWVLDADRLERGQLLEVEVELDADETFRASTVMSTLLEFIEEMPQMPESLDGEALVNAVTGTRLLDKLLAGLVPLRGRVLDYAQMSVDGRQLIVHAKIIAGLNARAEQVRPVYVVGVAEQGLFWRDIRRVLFSDARYRMLARLGRDGLQPDWTPVKLMDVLEDAVPTLRGVVAEIPSLLASMRNEDRPDERPAQLLRHALQRYAQDVMTIYGHPLSTEELARRGLPTAEQCESHATLESRRAAFRALTDALIDEFQFEPQPEVLVACRTEALIDAQLLSSGSVAMADQSDDAPERAEPARYLDCEIVAVYW